MGWERRWTSGEAADLRRFARERAAEMKYRDAWREERTVRDESH